MPSLFLTSQLTLYHVNIVPGLGFYMFAKYGLPWWFSWWRIHMQCRRPGFDSWVGKNPWRSKRLPTPVFWPGEFQGLSSLWGCKELDMTEWLSLFHFQHNLSFFLVRLSWDSSTGLFSTVFESSTSDSECILLFLTTKQYCYLHFTYHFLSDVCYYTLHYQNFSVMNILGNHYF